MEPVSYMEDPLTDETDLSLLFYQSLSIQALVESGLVKKEPDSTELLSQAALPYEPEVRIVVE